MADCLPGLAPADTLLPPSPPPIFQRDLAVGDTLRCECAPTGPSRGEVLVVDDEEGIRELLLAGLAGAGYRGAGAATAAEALFLRM